MVGFYIIIAMWTWFYTGQPEQEVMLACKTTVAEALAAEEATEGVVSELVARLF